MPEPIYSTRRKRRSNTAGWLAAGAVAGLLALVAAVVAFNASGPTPTTSDLEASPEAESRSDSSVDKAALDVSSDAVQLVDDPQGELLWVSPTSGPVISLAYAPAGTQCLVHLRPARLLAHAEGGKALAALGPWGQRAAERLRSLTGAELAELEAVLLAVVAQPDGELDGCLRIELTTPWIDAELAERFPEGRDERHGEQTYRVVGDRAYFLPSIAPGDEQEPGRTLVVCPAGMVSELIDSAGAAPALIRDVERLVQHADADRLATVIVVPRFLQARGVELLAATGAPLRDAMEWLMGSDATAAAFSVHWGDDFFLELRATPALNVPPRRLAARLVERVVEAPEVIEQVVARSPQHAHGEKVLDRFPAMLRRLAEYTRRGEEDQQALVRAYLPAIAGHNLLMGAELLLSQPDEATLGEEVGGELASGSTTSSLAGRLDRKTSLAFTKETLEQALALLSEDLGVEIVIEGAELQVDGITRNQSLELELRDRPGREVLVEILRRANPDRTASGPADARQKLVYILRPPTGESPERIIVTTRTAAEKRGDKLPDIFLGTGE